jgi:hypothetical protein
MADKEYQSLPQPPPPVGFPVTAPPDFAIPHEVTRFQRGGKSLLRAIRQRIGRPRQVDAVKSAPRS